MFNARGGGWGKSSKVVEETQKATVSGVSTDSSGTVAVAGATQAVDLIQPHSVSAEEVAGFYGCTMGQARLL